MKFILYRDRKGEHRWRLKASNGRIIAESGEGYKRKKACRTALSNIILNILYETYEIEEK